jgi:hypothetical protein
MSGIDERMKAAGSPHAAPTARNSAGGKNPERLDECVQAVPGIVEKML